MHELAIAQSVMEIALGEMEKHGSRAVRKIKISIGEFSGVVKEALEFAFEVIRPGTAAAGAEVEIEVVPMQAVCMICSSPVACDLRDLKLLCPRCHRPAVIQAGREMKVDYVDLD